MNTAIRLCVGLFLCSSMVMATPGATSNKEKATPFTTKTKSVVLFKNGLGYFQRQGTVNLNSGDWVQTPLTSKAVMGSFWVGTFDKNLEIKELVSSKEKLAKQTDSISMDEMLKANIGKLAVIYTGSTSMTGYILSIPEDRKNQPTTFQDSRYGYSPYSYNPNMGPQTFASNLVLLKDASDSNKIITLQKNQIFSITFPEGCNTQYNREEETPVMKIRLDGKSLESDIALSYLQKGIIWVPSYFLDLKDDTHGKLNMKAAVINEAEDLENTEINFAVGFPRFQFAEVITPLNLDQTIQQFINALNNMDRGQGQVYGASNVYMSQNISYDYDNRGNRAIDFGYSANNLSGKNEEDLFFYNLKDVSLKQGERGEYPVFSTDVDLKHIYEWSVGESIKTGSGEQKDVLWHSLRMTNKSKLPWTTGAVFVSSNGKPVAQSSLNYTPNEGKNNLKITVASDVMANSKLTELSRGNGVNFGGTIYYPVTVKGTLTLHNFKAEPIDVEATKKISGKVIDAGKNGKITVKADILKAVNLDSQVVWNIHLNPGETQTWDYTYESYVM